MQKKRNPFNILSLLLNYLRMKRLLPAFGIALSSLAVSATANAQIWSQNFNTGLPTGWSMIKVDNNVPDGTVLAAEIVTKLTSQAWMTRYRAAGDSVMLTASKFSPAGKADRWLISQSFQVTSPNMVISWEEAESISGYGEDSLQIWVSPTAGTTTAAFTSKIYDYALNPYTENGGVLTYFRKGASLAAYNGQTIRVAFRENSTNKGAIRLDNVQTEIPANAIDAGVTAVIFPKIAVGSPTTTVTTTIKNNGANTLTSLQLSYKVDAGTPVTQTFSGLSIPPYGSANLTFSTAITSITLAAHTLTGTVIQANGVADPVASNNTMTVNFAGASGTVTRAGLIEEFTSSTCVPCAAFNLTFDPLLQTNNANVASSNFNVVKYQMNWPAPGNDVSYNNDGLARRTYYGVTGIPDHYTNGKFGGAGNQAEITASKTDAAFMSITGSYVVKGDSVIATAVVTPNFNMTGATTKVHMALAEKQYTNNGATTTQKQYYHVMRMMLGAGAGQTVSNWTAGTPQTFTYRAKYTVGTVSQMSNIFWSNPFNSNLIVFVQDDANKEVMQSKVIPAQWPTSVKEMTGVEAMNVYPNPATDVAHVVFSVKDATKVSLQVTDAVGRVVYTSDAAYTAGNQVVSIPTAGFSAGLYNITLRSESNTLTQRLSVVK